MKRNLVAASLALAACSSAFATSSATVTVSDLRYQLLNLQPGDAAPASLSWEWVESNLGLDSRFVSTPGYAVAGSLSTAPGSSVTGFASITNANGSTTLTSSYQADASALPVNGSAVAQTVGLFTLGPYSEVIFAEVMRINATQDIVGLPNTAVTTYSGMCVYPESLSPLDCYEHETTGSLDFTYDPYLVVLNTTDQSVNYYFNSDTWLTFTTTTPIPEPTNVALMLAGLGLIGAAGRRRSLRSN